MSIYMLKNKCKQYTLIGERLKLMMIVELSINNAKKEIKYSTKMKHWVEGREDSIQLSYPIFNHFLYIP